MNQDEPRVAIIVLNWNGLEDTLDCLESLKKITYPNYEVIVVDNASQGNDVAILSERCSDYVHIIRNDKNYGYAGGNNVGINYGLAHPQPDYFLLLNNDTVVAPDFLTRMINAAQSDGSVGVVGPKVYYYDYPNRLQTAGGRVNMWTGRTSLIGFKGLDTGRYDTLREVDYVCGCCLLLRTEVAQTKGLLDDSYFCYWEEIEYCTRIRKAGYKILYVPEARIWHKKILERKLWNRFRPVEKSSSLLYYYWPRNTFRLMRRHATEWQYRSFLLYFFAYYFWLTATVCLFYHGSIGQLIAFYRGTRDGLLNSDAGARSYRED